MEKNGKGIKYDFYGDKIFEDEYLNDKIWNGKGSNCEDELTFEGEDKNGKRWNGFGKERGCTIACARIQYIYKDGKKYYKHLNYNK